MADNPAAMTELRALLKAREGLYAQAAHTVDTHARSLDAVVDDALERLESQAAPQ
jgi:shikimate kinase